MRIFNDQELSFFHANGFLIKKGLLNKNDCQNVVDIAWKYLPKTFDIARKETWRGQVTCSCNVTQNLKLRRGHVKIQKDKLNKYPEVRSLVAENPDILEAVQELIGYPLGAPIFRGLYYTFPIPKILSFPYYGHLESHSFQVGVVAYCSNVKKNGGGLNVWPGSHWEFHNSFNRKIGFFSNQNYHLVEKLLNKRKPLTIEGDIGDVIFTHHRLFHSPSNNNSDVPRSAFFCDFKSKNWKNIEKETSSYDPFEAFESFKSYEKSKTFGLLVDYDNAPERLRLIATKYPFINTIYGKFAGNKTTYKKSVLSYNARFDK